MNSWLCVLLALHSLAAMELQAKDDVCINYNSRTECGYYGIEQQECNSVGCCWDPSDADDLPWCFSKKVMPPNAICTDEGPREDCGNRGISEAPCLDRGCCWSPSDIWELPWCFYRTPQNTATRCEASGPRFGCGTTGTNQYECIQFGCCWDPSNIPNEPWCFSQTPIYRVNSVVTSSAGVKLTVATEKGVPGTITSPLVFELTEETDSRVHVKIYDPSNERWEVPQSLLQTPPSPQQPPSNPLYTYYYSAEGEEFYFAISRKSDGDTIFNTSYVGLLTFSDQYITIGTNLPNGYNVYGLGERKDHLRISPNGGPDCGNVLPLFSNDMPFLPRMFNLYGVHPFYLELRNTSANAHGVFLKNSNAMDVILFPTALQYKITGGILDFYFFLGPGPEAVISQYLDVIGRPLLPPFWSLGYHQSRFGYRTIDEIETVVDDFAKADLPLETIWCDIDYMDQNKDFTLDPVRYPVKEVQRVIEKLHSNNQYIVFVVDPGIAIDPGYPAYDRGISDDIFIKDNSGNDLIGKVWPGFVHFPDFLHPKAESYWEKEFEEYFNNLANIDGIWLDMNECANFCNGYCDLSRTSEGHRFGFGLLPTLPESFNPRKPPYNINNRCSRAPLSTRTLPVDAVHYGNILEYDAHNLFGHTETMVTYNVMKNIRPNKRPFILTRSTFAGTGPYAAHWNGDNTANEEDLYYSIPMMLSYQLFGMPFVGSDICGFFEDTTEELCARWMQLGAFYPFSRNHNNNGQRSQEPYRWESVAKISKIVLEIRYGLLSYYYTLFYKANRPSESSTVPSATVMRPLFFEFPQDSTTYPIDWQFMVGSALLISPVLRVGEAGKTVTAYFPEGAVWYDFYTGAIVSEGSESITIDTPLDYLPIHVRGGSIIPQQVAYLTTAETKKAPFYFIVALSKNGEAKGDLYIDDGESIDNSGDNLFVTFEVSNGELSGSPEGTFSGTVPLLASVSILGVHVEPTSVSFNGNPVEFYYDSSDKYIEVGPILNGHLNEPLTLKWN